MGTQVGQKNYYTFVKGLNTEAGPLTFPENTWLEGDNVYPKIDGSINKRLALDLESSFAYSSTAFTNNTITNHAISVGLWNNVAGDGSRNFVVVQVGTTLLFYDNYGPTVSDVPKSFSIDLATYKVANDYAAGIAPCSYATGDGKLFIVSRDTDPIVVSYTISTDTISVSEIEIQFRDFNGAEDGLEVDERPTTLSIEHKYNLYNQGWNDTNINSYYSSVSKYPSNAQTWVDGKDASDNFLPSLLDKQDFGTSPAPRGRYVLDLFSRDRSTASGIPGLTTEEEDYRPTTVTFYAGRVWYAGTSSDTIGTWILFSQVANKASRYGKCYQNADPTSEVLSDLVATDGGVIPIPEAGSIIRLVPAGDGVLVFAENGIWQIRGKDTGFSADGYTNEKISAVGAIAPKAIVEVEDAVIYWATTGIYMLQQDQVSGLFKATPLTDNTIKTLYDAIPHISKRYASGFYDLESKKVIWQYNSDPDLSGIEHRFKKDKLLFLDIRLGSFYTYTISNKVTLWFCEGFQTSADAVSTTVANVVDGSGNQVIDGSSNTVVVDVNQATSKSRSNKFLTVIYQNGDYKISFGDFDNTRDAPSKFYDWYSYDSLGSTFEHYLVTGYEILGDASRKHQAMFLVAFMNKTEDGYGASAPDNQSSIMMQARWEWTDSSTPNRWTTAQEIYRHKVLFLGDSADDVPSSGFPVLVTKSKIRGHGRALSLKFYGATDKDFQLLGWTIIHIGNQNV